MTTDYWQFIQLKGIDSHEWSPVHEKQKKTEKEKFRATDSSNPNFMFWIMRN